MNKQPNLVVILLPALLLLALAGLVHFFIADRFEELPADYAHHLEYEASSQLRRSITGPMESSVVSVHNDAQALTVNGHVIIIQNDLFWYTTAGDLIFQSTGLYGVDRSTRLNLAGYGNTSRYGQFLFPPGIKKEPFSFWDAMFIGPRQAEFEQVEMLEDLKVYRFHFHGLDMDETAGYSSQPDVPEDYQVHTDGEGTLWIEPLSGVLVDYEESGVSYYVDPVSNENLADLFVWRDTFTAETRTAQAALARTERIHVLAFKYWLPGLLLVAGLLWLPAVVLVVSPRPQKEEPSS